MADRLAGHIEMTINGRPFAAKANMVIDPGVSAKPAVLDGKGKVIGYTEEHRAPTAKGTVTKTKSTHVTNDVLKADDGTIVFKSGDGTRWLFSEAWQSGGGSFAVESGEIDCEITGVTCTEIAP